jgi:hypothetical protein
MLYPDEKVPKVCALGPIEGQKLLERARAGDLGALADWTVLAVYRKLQRLGATPAQALHHTRVLIGGVDLKPKVVL